MKPTLLLCIAILGLSGCSPKEEVKSHDKKLPPSHEEKLESLREKHAHAVDSNKEALKTELADLRERRKTAWDLLNELDGKITDNPSNDTIVQSSRELYLPIGEKLFEIQKRITELDKQLGTSSNRKRSDNEKAEAIKASNEEIARLEGHIATAKESLENQKDDGASNRFESQNAMFVKYAELKIKLLKQQLESIN